LVFTVILFDVQPGMRKRLIFAEAHPKKVQLKLPSFLKNRNLLEQLFYRLLCLQKMILKNLFNTGTFS